MPREMVKPQITPAKTNATRRGRPPRERAGEVEDRILQAALHVFITRGYEGASIDEIAEVARAGKPSIYARFINKETLFRTVVLGWIERSAEAAASSTSGNIEERFQSAGLLILQRAITDETIGLVRSVMGEATRHPELATNIHYAIRAHGTATVMELMAELAEAEEISSLPAFATGNLEATARYFIDLVLLPILMSALFHADLTPIKAQMLEHARQASSFFLAGCGYQATPDDGRSA